ncbi:MAG: response regulator [Rhodospirillaceae bacterium]
MATILLVDDSRVARMSLRRSITALMPDATIVEAGSADEAVVVAAQNSVAAALIDFNMPGRTGLELAEELHATYPALRMALVTANIQDAVAERARALGMTFIPKPPDAAVMETFLRGDAA